VRRSGSAGGWLTGWVTEHELEVGSGGVQGRFGRNGERLKLRRVLSDPDAKVIVVDYRDRLARLGVEHVAAHGGRVVNAHPGEATDDLVREMIGVLTSMCARLYGRCGAGNRVMRAITATKRESGEAA
jgi:putative resolvase